MATVLALWLVVALLHGTGAAAADIVLAGPGAHTYIVDNRTITTAFGGQLLSVTGSGNTILLGSSRFLGHNHVRLIGNNNYITLGPAGGFLALTGSGNTVDVGEGGGDASFNDYGSSNVLVLSPTHSVIVFGTGVSNDKLDLTRILTALGCGDGCNPGTVLALSRSGRTVLLQGTSGSGKTRSYARFRNFLPCGVTLAQLLARSILPAATPRSWPSLPPPAKLPPAGNVDANDIVLMAPADYRMDTSDRHAFFNDTGLAIADPYAYATPGATVTVTLSATAGIVRLSPSARGKSAQVTGPITFVNEALANARYAAPKGVASDRVTLTATNSGGGTATRVVPVTITTSEGCPR